MTNAVSIDIGGTFTDLVSYDSKAKRFLVTKRLTTHDDYVNAVNDCMGAGNVDVPAQQLLKHGTTIVINALLERSGSPVAVVTTRGFRDVIELGRGGRHEAYNLFYRRSDPLASRPQRYEVDERTTGQGVVEAEVDRDQLQQIIAQLPDEIKAVAVCFINSYANGENETRAIDLIRETRPDLFVCASSRLSGTWHEYERFSTAVANAYVGPRTDEYLLRLSQSLENQGFAGSLFMMGSSGGVLPVSRASEAPVELVESGPVGGAIGAAVFGDALDIENLISFDMGGTTAKCTLVSGGRFDVDHTYYVGGYGYGLPIQGSVLDIVEVGAGGGSIAWVDQYGGLHVGPKSAGSDPGPASYGLGGQEPTVTDANVALGRLQPKGLLGDRLTLNADKARDAISDRVVARLSNGVGAEPSEDDAAGGILSIANVVMAGALKRVTVERGRDPREYVLFAYGGAGPLHARDLAIELNIPSVVVPPNPGNFSAVGMLLSDVRRDNTRTYVKEMNEQNTGDILKLFEEEEELLAASLTHELGQVDIRFERAAEVRYRGQAHSLMTPLDGCSNSSDVRSRFDALYAERYGHSSPLALAEFVNLKVSAFAATGTISIEEMAPENRTEASPKAGTRPVFFLETSSWESTQIFERSTLPVGFSTLGPAIVEESGSTTVVGPRDRLVVGSLGELWIHVQEAPTSYPSDIGGSDA